MEKVSGLRQRIAGKSIPVEVGHGPLFPQISSLNSYVSMVPVDRNSPPVRHASTWLKRTGLSYQHLNSLTYLLPLLTLPARSYSSA